MLISPSQATVKAGLPESVAAKPIVPAMGIGAIAANAVAVANMAATKRKREETPVVEERTCFVLLDTGASGRNFISSTLASWLIECGSITLEMSGEIARLK